MPPPDILILGSRAEGWHGGRLKAALAAAGCTVARLAFDRCRIELGAAGPGGGSGLRLGELEGLPGAVLVRSIPGGSFEQVTLRLGLLHALEASGVPVCNPPRAIERCVDKAMTSFLLARAGLPVPATWVTERAEMAQALARQAQDQGFALVLKPLFGAQGKGLRLVRTPEDLPDPAELAGVHYLQRFVGRHEAATATWSDYRVLVAGGAAVAAMARHGTHWITNVGQGGVPQHVPATGRRAELAVAAARILGCDHAGVDLIEDEQGKLLVLEVNSMPAWQGLQSVSTVDIAAEIAADLVRRLRSLRR